MPRRKLTPAERTPVLPVIGNVDDPNSLYHWAKRFLAHREARHYSTRTLETQARSLRYFILWSDERGLQRPNDITKPILEQYQRSLFHHRKANGQPLSVGSQNGRIAVLKSWFSWLTKGNHLLANPASDLERARQGIRLPRAILSVSEAECVVNQPDVSTVLGLRDRAILETFYSTGIRRMELINLCWSEVDYDRGTVLIVEGKGKKDRLIPIGDRALQWLEQYFNEARPRLTLGKDDGTVFVTHLGERFNEHAMSKLVRDYITQADIGKTGSCHLFRHTCATLMLEGGADVRFVQAQLGHVRLDTTSLYTQVAIQKLKEVHRLTHPAQAHKTGNKADDEV